MGPAVLVFQGVEDKGRSQHGKLEDVKWGHTSMKNPWIAGREEEGGSP